MVFLTKGSKGTGLQIMKKGHAVVILTKGQHGQSLESRFKIRVAFGDQFGQWASRELFLQLALECLVVARLPWSFYENDFLAKFA